MKNVDALETSIKEVLALVSKNHQVTECDAGEFRQMTAHRILKFKVKQYEIEKIGNLSVMTVNAGIMQMSSIVFTPVFKDLPLMSCDYMYILGNRKAYVELYDLVNEKSCEYDSWLSVFRENIDKYKDLQDITVSEAWYAHLLTVAAYKAGKARDDERLMALLLDMVKAYTDEADAMPLLSDEGREQKLDIIKKYSDRLIDEGGVSTDFFKKTFGEELTRRFFDRVFFGSEKYRG